MVQDKRFALALVLALAGHFFLLALPGMRISAPVAPAPQPQRVTIRLTAPLVAAPQPSKPVPVSRPEPRPVEPQVKQPRIPVQAPARETAPEPEPVPLPRTVTLPAEPVPRQQVVNETAAPAEDPVSDSAPESLPTPPASSPMVTLAYPKYRQNPAPRYPAAARRRGLQGIVLLEVLVNPAGRVEELRLARSSGHSLLDRAASKTVRAWRFVPGRRGNKKIAMWVRVPVRFELHQAR